MMRTVRMRTYRRDPVGGEGFAPPPHDDDELLFKSRVLLLFKIPIPKLLHARAQRERTSLSSSSSTPSVPLTETTTTTTMTICCCLFVLRVCASVLRIVPSSRYCYYGKHVGLRSTATGRCFIRKVITTAARFGVCTGARPRPRTYVYVRAARTLTTDSRRRR